MKRLIRVILVCDVICDVIYISQVGDVEKELKMKIRPENAYFKLHDHAFLLYMSREELHQFLIGTYGEYVITVLMHCIK